VRPSLDSFLDRVFGLEAFPDAEIVRTRYPMVLIHGFGAMGTLFTSGLLQDQAAFLRQRGTLAFAPNVTPYDTTRVRCEGWAGHLERVLEMTGAERLNLIGYSAGGLDARALASSLGFGARLASVITVATPNRGSALASWTLEQRPPVRDVVIGAMDVMGRLSYRDSAPRVEAGLRELTPEHVDQQFNPDNPDVSGVFYGSFAGRAGLGTDTRITPLQVIQNRILFRLAGVNDGMVPLSSAPWGELMGVVRSDHLRMCGVAPGSREHANRFFLHIARELASRGL
jgi:triacylglycerol lipase